MEIVALIVIVVMIAVSAWAWKSAPGQEAANEFVGIWRGGPWGMQFFVDFFGLPIILALWMVTDAAARGSWLLAGLCLLAMPIFGSVAAAAYWLLHG